MAAGVFIETPRLILRTVTMEDIDQVALSWELDEKVISQAEAEDKIRWMQGNHLQNRPGQVFHLCLGMIHKETREIMGWCGLDHRNQALAHPVLFYLLKAPYWGQGLATEAAQALVGYAFGGLALAQIDAAAAPDNLASRHVMEKIGMRYVGLDEEGGYAFTLTGEEYYEVRPASAPQGCLQKGAADGLN